MSKKQSKKTKTKVESKKNMSSRKNDVLEQRIEKNQERYDQLNQNMIKLELTTKHTNITIKRIEGILKNLDVKLDTMKEKNDVQIQAMEEKIIKNSQFIGWLDKIIIAVLIAGTTTAIIQGVTKYFG